MIAVNKVMKRYCNKLVKYICNENVNGPTQGVSVSGEEPFQSVGSLSPRPQHRAYTGRASARCLPLGLDPGLAFGQS